MPPLGAAARAEQLATLARLAHDHWTAPELGSLLEELRELEESFEPESFEASVVRVARRDYEKKRHVPSDLRAEMTRAGSLGYAAWLEARAAADYELFRPHLERRIELTHEYVACHEPYDDPYDALLDDHERRHEDGARSRRSSPASRTSSCRSSPASASRSTTRASTATSRRSASGSSRSRCCRAGGWTTRRGGSTTPCIRSP